MAGEENEIPPYVDESLNQNDIDQNDNNQSADQNERLLKLPITRIKTLIKMDPDVTLASQEAVVTLAKATELFISTLAKDASVRTLRAKRKTLLKKDFGLLKRMQSSKKKTNKENG